MDEAKCDHRDYQDITIRLGAGIREVERVCGNEECAQVLYAALPRATDREFTRKVTIGRNEWRITVERIGK